MIHMPLLWCLLFSPLPQLLIFLSLGDELLLQLGLHGRELGLDLAALLPEDAGGLRLLLVAGVQVVIVCLEGGQLYVQVLSLL